MRPIFFLSTLLLTLSANAEILPTGDNAILSLGMANLTCAAVQKITPHAVDKISENYLKDSIRLYQLYHDNDYETAKSNQISMLNVITGETAIKAQSLRSVKGAKSYLEKSLLKTGATECSQLRLYAQKILSQYGVSL